MAVRKPLLATDMIDTYAVDKFFALGKTRQMLNIFNLALAYDRLWATLALWRKRVRERRELASLPTYLLKDIGVTRAEADAELAKPFWRA